MSTKLEAIKRILETDGDTVAVSIWCREDVKGIAMKKGLDISDDSADVILNCVESHMDATIGINWDTVGEAIDRVIEDEDMNLAEELSEEAGNEATE